MTIVKESFSIFKRKLPLFLLLVLITWLPFHTAAELLAGTPLFSGYDRSSLSFIFTTLMSPLTIATVYYTVFNYKTGTPVTVKETVLFALDRWFPLIISGVIAGMITMVSFVLIVPGIFFLVRYSFIPCVVCFRKSTALPARIESFRVTKGIFWKILRVLSLLYLISLMAQGLLQAVPLPPTGGIYFGLNLIREFFVTLVGILPEIGLVLLYFYKIKDNEADLTTHTTRLEEEQECR